MGLALAGMLLSDCLGVASVFLTVKRSWDLCRPKDCSKTALQISVDFFFTAGGSLQLQPSPRYSNMDSIWH